MDTPQPIAPAARPGKILFVDHDMDHMEVCKEIMSMRGHDVKLLFDTRVLLNVVKQFMPDLIFMDHYMPHIRGTLATQLLKNHALLKHIPVIYFSAHHNINEVAAEAGADTWLAKPFQIERMIELAEQYI
jgi:two-component system cell cycle response regulator DivK